MNISTYYGLNLAEGSDIVNPLVVDVPNYEKIDEVMHDNATAGVGTATELLTGSVHALVRDNDETAIFRFIATANFTAGDTFTVDGVQVTALLPSGESLGTGAYVINANVLCILTGTLLTMYVPSGVVAVAEDSEKLGGELPSYYGTASDVQNAINIAQASGVLVNQLNGAVSNLENSRVVYNSDTDKLDVYVDGAIIGSINAGFQFSGIYKDGTFYNNFGLGNLIPFDGDRPNRGGFVNVGGVLSSNTPSSAGSIANALNGSINLTPYNTLTFVTSKGTKSIDISNINSVVYFTIYNAFISSGRQICGLTVNTVAPTSVYSGAIAQLEWDGSVSPTFTISKIELS